METVPATVHRVARLLDGLYPQTNLGNKKNPLDELVYIMLSSQTSEAKYQRAYLGFKHRFPRWDLVAEASTAEIRESISSAGLGSQKASYLKAIVVRLKKDFGRVSLVQLRNKPTDEAEQYLLSLRGVGVKTARCILMYSLGREVFPADVHCYRIMERLGWLEWRGRTSKGMADRAQRCVPPDLRRGLHIRFVQHGRAVCTIARPKCDACVLQADCPRIGVEPEATAQGL